MYKKKEETGPQFLENSTQAGSLFVSYNIHENNKALSEKTNYIVMPFVTLTTKRAPCFFVVLAQDVQILMQSVYRMEKNNNILFS